MGQANAGLSHPGKGGANPRDRKPPPPVTAVDYIPPEGHCRVDAAGSLTSHEVAFASLGRRGSPVSLDTRPGPTAPALGTRVRFHLDSLLAAPSLRHGQTPWR